MLELIKVDPQLADAVEVELSSARPKWQYSPITTPYYDNVKDERLKNNLDILRQQYPVFDTQKFTDTFFNSVRAGSVLYDKSGNPFKTASTFVEIRQNPNSRYNKEFPNMAKLINHVQLTHIPKNYVVKRLMVNMQTIRPTYSLNEIHPDFSKEDFITILYYVNNSDGDTYFFKETECVYKASPIKGTAVVFPSNMLHAGSTPTKTEKRIVINICFAPKDTG